MYNFINKHAVLRNTMIMITLVSISPLVFYRTTKTAHAQMGVVSSALAVPISTGYDYNITMQHMKDFVLDRLATILAKQILHQMTMSVVNWINSGFDGSPSFLTNPEGFFLNAADQVTGAFLSTEGPLSQLCSPFSVDVRLSLAKNQAALIDQPYKCTLSTIVDNLSNIDSTPIYVNGQNINTNRSTVDGFLSGDFSQGGWQGFLALTTEPQNNPYGSYLQAQSDLNSRINARQNAIKLDLQMGRGFMSWQKCTDMTDTEVENSGLSDDQFNQLDKTGSASLDKNTSMKTVRDEGSGEYKFQSCETQTPGSVIENSLADSLGSPMRELELADDINAVIDALISQLMTQVLTNGLHAISSNTNYSSNGSFTQSVMRESQSAQQAQATLSDIQSEIGPAIENVSMCKSYYDQAVSLVKESENRYNSIKSCLENKAASANEAFENLMIQGNLSTVENELNNNINPLLDKLLAGQAKAASDLANLQDISYSISGTGSVSTVQNAANKYTTYLRNGGLNASARLGTAQSDLETAQTKTATWNVNAVTYQNSCNSY